nr:EOG090X0BM2 [Lepidurus arcticus]
MFFGTDDFARESLKALHTSMQDGQILSKLAVVTPKPKPKPCPVAQFAESHCLPLQFWPLTPDYPLESFDLGVVASFGHLIPQNIISTFPLGMLNTHASLLPRWRGAAPITHAVLNGDQVTGITLMRIRPHHFDVGEIVLQESYAIPSSSTVPQITAALASIGARLLIQCLQSLEARLAASVSQPAEGITYAPKVDQSLATIQWPELDAWQVYNRWRALGHTWKLRTTFHGLPVKLDQAFLPVEATPPGSSHYAATFFSPLQISGGREISYPSGHVILHRKLNRLFVRCKSGWLPFAQIYVANKPLMNIAQFGAGYLLQRPPDQHFFS